MGCLDDETLWAFTEGKLPVERLPDVDAHLDSCLDCRDAVIAVTRSGEGVAAELAETAPLPAPGARVGRFVVLHPVGAGAMGVVYAAHDPELDRKVAIKLLRPDVSADSDRARERVLSEAQSMARLSHPNVVTVYEVGTHGDDVFVAMELVDGSSLRAWLEEAPRSTAEILRVLGEAGRGLLAAHDGGLVHRDFKPDNVVVDSSGRARVTDFGLARATRVDEPPSSGEPQLSASAESGTRTALAGTPAYMAPELFAGSAADARSDQFAFAVTAFEALYGKRPFAGDDERRPSARAVRFPDVPRRPRWLRSPLARALSLDPSARFGSMAALLDALAPRQSSWKWVGAAASVAAVAVVAAVMAPTSGDDAEVLCSGGDDAVSQVWNGERAARVREALSTASPTYGSEAADAVVRTIERWASSWIAMHESTCRATRVTGEQSEALLDVRMSCLQRRLGALDALATELEGADPRMAEVAVDAALSLPAIEVCANIDALTQIRPPPAGAEEALSAIDAQIARGHALVSTGRYDEARPLVEAARAAADEIGHPPALGEVQLLAADLARAEGSLDAARDLANEALWAFEEGRDDDGAARAWLAVMSIEGALGRFDRAGPAGTHAASAVARLDAPPELDATLRHGRGIVATSLGEFDEAQRELDRALALRRESVGDAHPETARVHTSLGNLARLRGDYGTALRHHRAALAMDTAALGDAHPGIGRHHHNIAGVLRLTGAHEDALAHYERAAAIKRAALGPDHPDVALTENSLGLIHDDLGRPEEARPHYEEALRIFAAAGHADEALAQHNLGLLDLRAGDAERARARFARARAIWEETLGPQAKQVGATLVSEARALVALGRGDDARDRAARATEIATALGDPELAAEARAAVPARPRRRAREPAASSPPPAPAVSATTTPRPFGSGVYGAGQAWD